MHAYRFLILIQERKGLRAAFSDINSTFGAIKVFQGQKSFRIFKPTLYSDFISGLLCACHHAAGTDTQNLRFLTLEF